MQAQTKTLGSLLGWSLIVLSTVLALLADYWCWIFRDGIEPDTVASTSYAVVAAAAADGCNLLVPGLVVGCESILCLRRRAS
jgi:hypothetical protein